jgi:hypothetical protein
MKHILIILALTTALHAAEPVVVVTSATNVTVDGVPWGKPADVIANNAALAPAVQHALEAWAAAQEERAADAEAELTALKTRIDAVLNGMLTEELKSGDGPRAAVLRTLINEAQKSDKQLKAEALAAEIAAKQAELEALK